MKETLLEVFKIACKEIKHMKQWILEIMGQVLFLLRQNCSVWTFNFMFEMFVLSLSALAGNFDDPSVNYKVMSIFDRDAKGFFEDPKPQGSPADFDIRNPRVYILMIFAFFEGFLSTGVYSHY